jgi:Holliday junction resolvase RusA-like endonuclease
VTIQPTLDLFADDPTLTPVALDPSCCVSTWWEGIERHDWNCPLIQAELNELSEREAVIRQLVKHKPLPTTAAVLPTHDPITFDVLGSPVPQGSKRAMPIYRGRGDSREFTGRATVIDNKHMEGPLKAWRSEVKSAAEQYAGRFPRGSGLVVVVFFSMKRPISAPKKRRTYPVSRPDVDKLIRAVLDAMKDAALYFDDGQVLDARGVKDYAGFGDGPDHPGARITVSRAVG